MQTRSSGQPAVAAHAWSCSVHELQRHCSQASAARARHSCSKSPDAPAAEPPPPVLGAPLVLSALPALAAPPLGPPARPPAELPALLVPAAGLTPEPPIIDVPPVPSRGEASTSLPCLDAQAKTTHASKQKA